MNNADLTQLMFLLSWLAGPLGATAWMVFFSNAVRNLRIGDVTSMDPYSSGVAGWIRKMTPIQLQTFVTVMSLGVPLLAALILRVVPAEALAKLQDTYSLIAGLLMIYLAQQIWFQITKPKATDTQPPTQQVVNITNEAPKEPSSDHMLADLISDRPLPRTEATFPHPVGKYPSTETETISFPGRQQSGIRTFSSARVNVHVFDTGKPFRSSKKVA